MLGWTLAATAIAGAPWNPASAQEARQFQVSGGPAASITGDGRDGHGIGAGASVEYVAGWTSWACGRLYAGGILTKPDEHSCAAGTQLCSVSSKIGIAGAKIRLLAPTPYVSPFLEVGAGLSVGSIETRISGGGFIQPIELDRSGLTFHVPLSLGLAFGTRHQHDIAFRYVTHRGHQHVAGIVALGIGFSWD
jgi:hypothetical protein